MVGDYYIKGVDDPALWAGEVGNSWCTTDDINDSWRTVTFKGLEHDFLLFLA
ncbi:conserved hypothetical protein [Ricinus communis]|uniref:Uncharacterized protein n=1 Tax=Ricinus communis TaxID=3988 RepID=B9SAM7_RICCO|nr:conserved hypothetical protein [Ricinus communis]